jgi:hypothetical protein
MTQARTDKKDTNRKKIVLILLCLLVSIGLVFGSLFAFFSDIVTGSNTVTAGTLNLEKGTETITQNEVDITDIGDEDNLVENFNPGDVVTISVTVTNVGSKSAWLRTKLTLTGTAVSESDFDSYFKVFDGTLTQTQAATADNPLTFSDGVLTTSAVIIDGDSSNNELEDVETEDSDTIDEAVGSNETTLTYTVYFLPTAGNKWQGKAISLAYEVQALQYRNNPTPNWTDALALE